ncbi:MAG: class A beta-lactamase-related serine hydrolase [Mesorhizobium sp.]|uniref:Beta-lactamase-related domain-containing protein n=2 Tax=Mesorhizobium mediterraneum TaxID=43617 RepID=A0AB36QZR6_9HYPH|nr:hypothetical protein CIT25_33505 [Mesorhizobium mediterraneum]RWN28915.1 MAG: class A beta-lactamase-related serine hydrolase [Mesorhizobium sp.]
MRGCIHTETRRGEMIFRTQWPAASVVAAPSGVSTAACFAVGDHSNQATLLQLKAQTLVADLVGADAAPGAAAYIIAPKFGMEAGMVAGVTERAGREPLTIERPIRISSVTKPFVAAAIWRVWEMGKIDLDQSIGSYLTSAHVMILTGGGYDVKTITVRHLLSHTAGLVDVFHTNAFTQMLPKLMTGQVKHRFTLEEQLKMAMEGGPRFTPGQAFEYSDTGYLLLAAILEKATGKSMAAATRELVGFDRLGLGNTWWEVLEAEPRGVLARAHQYEYVCGWDSYDEDPPHDLFGGGGMVSTPKDLARFFYALFHEEVFEKPETIHVMVSVDKTATPRKQNDSVYGHGPQIHKVGDLTVYAHGGWWGLDVGYVPELDMAVSVIGLRRDIRPRYTAAFDAIILEAAHLQAKP